jgi:hypothetical protein
VVGAAIILLEADDLGARVALGEAEDLGDVGAAPAVDRLVVVADDAELGPLAEQLDQGGLHWVGVLVLVDDDVGEAAAQADDRVLFGDDDAVAELALEVGEGEAELAVR